MAKRTLAPPLFDLFLQLQPDEQVHSLNILRALLNEGQKNPDLLAAALLHDVGKSCFPLKLWERVAIVLAGAIVPKLAHHWGQSQPAGWKRPLVIAQQHPAWGAEMAARAGASDLLVELIRRHQDSLPAHPTSPADQLLIHLKRYDDQA